MVNKIETVKNVKSENDLDDLIRIMKTSGIKHLKKDPMLNIYELTETYKKNQPKKKFFS